MRWMRAFALLAVGLSVASAQGSYFITLPDLVWAGSALDINVKIVRSTGPVTVDAQLLSNTNFNTSEILVRNRVTFIPGILGTLKLNIPSTIDTGMSNRFSLTFFGSGGLNFQNTTYVTIRPRKSPIFIQMDQHVYRPSDMVNIRAVVVNRMLKMEAGTITINVFDPNGNQIVGWTRVPLVNGVASQSFPLADKPPTGEWKTQVSTTGGLMEEKMFTVEEIDYNKFGVAIDTGHYWLDSSPLYECIVTALYPDSGNYVAGRSGVQVSLADYEGPATAEPVMSWGIHNLIDGEAKFQISRSILYAFFSNAGRPIGHRQTLRIDAVVQERTTHLIQNTSIYVTIYSDEYSIRFTASTPDNFKPGLDYRGAVKVMKVDGLPTNENVSVTVQATFVKLIGKSCWSSLPVRVQRRARRHAAPDFISSRTGCFPTQRFERDVDRVFTMTAGGVVPFSIPTQSNDTRVTVEVFLTHDNSTRIFKYINQMRSPSMNFLQITLLSNQPQSGDRAMFLVQSTEDVREVMYEVLARGQLVASNTAALSRGRGQIMIILTPQMAPLARLIVYYVRPGTGEVVADAINFNVADAFENKVNVSFNRRMSEPGTSVRLAVSADVASFVGMLVIDRSANTQSDADNDISETEIDTKLQEYVTGESEWPADYVRWLAWPVTGGDAQGVFENSKIQVLTDAWVYAHGPNTGEHGNMPAEAATPPPPPPPHIAQRPPGLKKIPQSTWIWTNSTVGPNGQAIIEATIPDSLTTWHATAFSVHARSGLGVAPDPAQFQSRSDFYIDMAAPTTIRRGEHMVVSATIHNNQNFILYVQLTLLGSASFKNLRMSFNNNLTETNGNQVVQVPVPRNGHIKVEYPIVPALLGPMSLVVTAESQFRSRDLSQRWSRDRVEKTVMVMAEGIMDSYTSNILVDLTQPSPFGGPMSTFLQTAELSLPPNAIPGTVRIDASLIGDLTGTALRLERLIKLPMGSGEQTMADLAPLVAVTRYLAQQNLLSPNLRRTAVTLMNQGYQRVLRFQRADGSFSPFGDRDDRGSVWLTAYVLNVFHEAQQFISIDTSIIVDGLEFILSRQETSGAFLSEDNVLRHHIPPGTYGREVAVTAYVVSALAIYRPTTVGSLQSRITYSITRTLNNFLRESLDLVQGNDPYTLALIAYAYELTGQTPNRAFNNLLLAAVTQLGGSNTLFWYQSDGSPPTSAGNPTGQQPPAGGSPGGATPMGGQPSAGQPGIGGLPASLTGLPTLGLPPLGPTTADGSGTGWRPLYRQARAVDVEIAGYALQILSRRGDIPRATQVVRWLNSQRNEDGGFVSTLDTVVALKGLTDFAVNVPPPSATVSVTAGGRSYSVNISSSNAQVLQTVQLPPISIESGVLIAGEGEGMIYGQVSVQYHVSSADPPAGKAYELDVNLVTSSIYFLLLRVCARYTKPVTSGLAVIEVGIPSGFIADVNNIRHPDLQMAKSQNGKVVIFLSQITGAPSCVQIAAAKGDLITNNHAVPVTVYSYYEPSERYTQLYLPQLLSSVQICNLCTQNCRSCPQQGRYNFN